MKQLYPMIIASCILQAAIVPLNSKAQCNCAPGVPATAITQSITIAPTTASSLTFNFQQFNPAIGTLTCVTLLDTITGVSTSGAVNTGDRSTPPGYIGPLPYTGPPVASDSTIFKFLLSLTNDVSGPGIDLSYDFFKTYGPDTLSYTGTPGDTVTYGPTNVITTPNSMATTSGNAAYLGLGTVPFFYTINGGMVDTKGGPNYRAKVTTIFGGTLNLTYYWCPAIILAYDISDFTAFKKDRAIQLQWTADNEHSGNTYEIEYSKDGSHYAPVGYTHSSAHETGNAPVSYSFQYSLTDGDGGKIYFRVKRTTSDGKATFTAIKSVNLEGLVMSGYQVYPNPVHDRVVIEFDRLQTGRFRVSLVNAVGQVIQQKQVILNGTNQIQMDLTTHQATGLYYLQASDEAHNLHYSAKVLIR